jgi:hypothetical protein
VKRTLIAILMAMSASSTVSAYSMGDLMFADSAMQISDDADHLSKAQQAIDEADALVDKLATDQDKEASWRLFLESMIKISIKQSRNGKPGYTHTCYPREGTCSDLFVARIDGKFVQAEINKDLKDNVKYRIVCQFNETFDASVCSNIDTGAVGHRMRVNGKWVVSK